jgi:hypothetical protein
MSAGAQTGAASRKKASAGGSLDVGKRSMAEAKVPRKKVALVAGERLGGVDGGLTLQVSEESGVRRERRVGCRIARELLPRKWDAGGGGDDRGQSVVRDHRAMVYREQLTVVGERRTRTACE